MSDYFMEALSGELNKEARSGLRAALRRVKKLGKRARHQAKRGAGLKGATKLGQAIPPEIKPVKLPGAQANTMDKKPTPAPPPLTPPPISGKAPALPLPKLPGNNAIPLRKAAFDAAGAAGATGGAIAGAYGLPAALLAIKGANARRLAAKAIHALGSLSGSRGGEMAAGILGMGGIGGVAGGLAGHHLAKKAAADAAGAIVKAILGDADEATGKYTAEETGVDDPRFGHGKGLRGKGATHMFMQDGTGKGLSNFKGTKAPTFTSDTKGGKPGNPTENPNAFGAGQGLKMAMMDMAGSGGTEYGTGGAPKVSKMVPRSGNAAYGTGALPPKVEEPAQPKVRRIATAKSLPLPDTGKGSTVNKSLRKTKGMLGALGSKIKGQPGS